MPQRPRPPRAEWNAAEDRTCAECGVTIRAGDRITWGVTGPFAHPPCAAGGADVEAAISHARRLRAEHAARHPKKSR